MSPSAERSSLRTGGALAPLRRLALGILLGVVACAPDAPAGQTDEWRSPTPFDTSMVRIFSGDTTEVLVEIAASNTQQQFGLMTRPTLDPNSGMIFTYRTMQDSSAGFWMYRTLIPLDIAFIDSAGRIVSIRQMVPCRSENRMECELYSPGARYQAALEVNRGFFDSHGIEVGDSVSFAMMAPGPG